jgi:hypothetical protein
MIEPVPTSSPPPPRWRRWLSIAATVAVCAALALVAYSCFKPSGRPTYSAPAQRLRDAGVTYVARGTLYVVAEPDGSFVALDEQERNQANRLSGCVIRWRPEVQGGVFQEDPRCGGATFDRAGASQSGGQALLRHPLKLDGKGNDERVLVQTEKCFAPENGFVRACSAFHTLPPASSPAGGGAPRP